MDNTTQRIAAPTIALMPTAPMTTALVMNLPLTNAPSAAARSRQVADGYIDRQLVMPAVGATAHATGQVSFADTNAVSSKVWAPPPRRVSL